MFLKRFLTGLSLGLLVVIGLALYQQVLFSQSALRPNPPLTTPPTKATPVLSAQTQALIASHPELVNPPRQDIRLVVISDLNSAYGSTDYEPEVDQGMTLLPFWQPDLVVCSGDMVAGQNPALSRDRIDAMWQALGGAPLQPFEAPPLPLLGRDCHGSRRRYGWSKT